MTLLSFGQQIKLKKLFSWPTALISSLEKKKVAESLVLTLASIENKHNELSILEKFAKRLCNAIKKLREDSRKGQGWLALLRDFSRNKENH